MSGHRGDNAVLQRTLGLGGIAWGTMILTTGEQIWRRLDDRGPTEIDRLALRLLGGRHVATGAFQLVFPARLQRVEVGVDLIHAASMVVLAVIDPRRRRPAILAAGLALAAALAEVAGRTREADG